MKLSHHVFDHGDVQLHCAAMGDPAAPLLLCLHGFPEYWGAWHDIMPLLARRFRVVAPDQRGFGRSPKPIGVEAYRTRLLADDMVALADELSADRPYLLFGHDWGASVAYAMAFRNPDRLSGLVIANGVHPATFQRAIIEDPDQRAGQSIHIEAALGGLRGKDGGGCSICPTGRFRCGSRIWSSGASATRHCGQFASRDWSATPTT